MVNFGKFKQIKVNLAMNIHIFSTASLGLYLKIFLDCIPFGLIRFVMLHFVLYQKITIALHFC